MTGDSTEDKETYATYLVQTAKRLTTKIDLTNLTNKMTILHRPQATITQMQLIMTRTI